MREDAKLSFQGDPEKPCGLDGARRVYWCHVPEIRGCWAPVIHSNCWHNERAALLLRSLSPTPMYAEGEEAHPYLVQAYRQIARVARYSNVSRLSGEEVVHRYKGAMRLKYAEALRSLYDEGLQPKHLKLSAFLKGGEKFKPFPKHGKPRMIFARAPEYNLELARYLMPLEHVLWRKLKGDCKGVPRTRVIGKGLNAKARAELIRRKMEGVGEGVVCFEVDGKSWESHLTRQDIVREHSIYHAAYPGDGYLRRLLQAQETLKGKTSHGHKFERPGCRASGDFNTGLGNSVCMLADVKATIKMLFQMLARKFKWDCLVDGDNAIIFVQGDVAAEVHAIFAEACARVCKQRLVVEKPTQVYEQIPFGQSQPLCVGDRVTMVREPFKVLSNSFSGYKHYENMTAGWRILKAVAQCELHLNRGVPLLQPYFQKALQELEAVPDLANPAKYLESRYVDIYRAGIDPVKTLAEPILPSTRISFQKAWGIDVEDQVALEEQLVSGLVMSKHSSWVRKLWGHRWTNVEVTDGPDGETGFVQDLNHRDALF